MVERKNSGVAIQVGTDIIDPHSFLYIFSVLLSVSVMLCTSYHLLSFTQTTLFFSAPTQSPPGDYTQSMATRSQRGAANPALDDGAVSGDFAFRDASLPHTVSDTLARLLMAQARGDAESWADAAARIVLELKTRIPELLQDVRAQINTSQCSLGSCHVCRRRRHGNQHH